MTIPDDTPVAPAVASPQDFISLHRHAALGGVDLIRAVFVTHASTAHAHSDFEIGVIGSGQRLVRCRGLEIHASAGSVAVFAPGEIHCGAPVDDTGSTYRSFLVSPGIMASLSASGARPWFAAPVFEDPALAARLGAIHQDLEQAGWDVARDSELRLVLTDLIAQRGSAPAPALAPVPDGVRQVRQHLEEHFASLVRLEPLARDAGLSVFQLIRRFRAATGLPPYAYLEQVRIDQAMNLLRAGVPIVDVAARTGFSDQSHLTRFFKRITGVPPGRYRRSVERVRQQAV